MNRLILYVLIIISVLACTSDKKLIAKNEEKTVSSDQLKIEYIAHASFILSFNEHSLLLDPFADSVWISYRFPAEINADAIFSTHPHYDHDGGIFRDLKPYWEGKIPFYQDPGTYTIGPFEITGIKGKHCDPYGKEFDQKNTIFIYEVGGIKLAHWGDNGPITEEIASALADVDILFLPIDDTYHILKADETEEVINRLQPRIVVPMHYKILELEPTPGRPKNLGPIDEYFQQKENITKLTNNMLKIKQDQLPRELQYYIFKHSPLIPTS